MIKTKPQLPGESILAYRRRKNITRMQRYREHRANGKCYCGKDPVEGGVSCQSCRDYSSQKSKKRRTRALPAKRAFGLCHESQCQQYAVPGRAYCGYHLEKKNDTARARTQSRITEGTCSRCSAMPEPNRRMCEKHLAMMRKSQARHRSKKSKGKVAA